MFAAMGIFKCKIIMTLEDTPILWGKWGLVQSEMKFSIEEFDFFVHSFDGTSFISIYLKIVWMDVN
jgi:hypothetical protein